LNEFEDFKSEARKSQWRDFITKYEKRIQDYNFGTLLRNQAKEDYHEHNCFFGKF
jgi:hypothetical protein